MVNTKSTARIAIPKIDTRMILTIVWRGESSLDAIDGGSEMGIREDGDGDRDGEPAPAFPEEDAMDQLRNECCVLSFPSYLVFCDLVSL